MNKLFTLATLVSVGAVAHAGTIATFFDPAVDGSTPLFVFDTVTNILTGSWTGTGLNVQTPGLIGGGVVNNAKFTTTPIQLTNVPATDIWTGGAGQFRFYTTDVNNPFLVVDFTGATLFSPLNFGASEFSGSIVNMSGPNVPAGLTNEQFSFSLANPASNGTLRTYTASYTSSAVPEPASMTALALGAAALLRRRRA